MSQLANSRCLSPRLEKLLIALEAAGFYSCDSRNKTARIAIELGFVAPIREGKRKLELHLTPRGANALERQNRGVDPYLVMTE